MGIPLPDNLTPLEQPFTAISVNTWWWSLCFGLLEEALRRDKWDVTDEEWIDVEQAVVELMTAMSCSPICTLTVLDDGTIQSTNSDGENSTIDTISDVFPETTDGVIPATSVPDARDSICGGVDAMVTYLADRADEIYDIGQQVLDEAVTIFAGIQLFIATASLGLSEFLPIDEIGLLLANVTQANITTLENYVNSVSNRELWWEQLYCRILANGNVFDQSVFEAWLVDDIEPVEPPAGAITERFSNVARVLVGWHVLRDRYSIGTYAESLFCRLSGDWCGDWCHVFDFSAGQQGWTVSEGSFVAGEFVSEHIFETERVRINLAIAPEIDITKIRVKWSATLPGSGGTRIVQQNVLPQTYKTLDSGAGSFDESQTSDRDGVDVIDIRVHTNNDAASTNKILEVEVCGSGSDPF